MAEKKTIDDSHTRRTPLKSYASKVFQESSVGLVSSLAHTASTRRRIFKVLALLICLTGFLYQSGKFLAVVFRYPTTVDIDIVRPNRYNVPAYTFCDNNGINRRIFCTKFPDRCEKPDKAFCKKYEYYCGEGDTMVPKKEYYNLIADLTLEDLIEFHANVTDFVSDESHERDEEIVGPFLRTADMTQSYLCYSLNDRVNNALYPRDAEKHDLIRIPINVLEFTVSSEEMFLPGNRAGILFAIHSPFQAVNPFEKGIFMKPGRTYMVFVSMDEEILLKDPYDTNCVNYTERWEKNGYSGPRLQDMCRMECIAEISMKCHNCVIPMLLYPTNHRYCTKQDFGREHCPENVRDLVDECDFSCRDDCRRTKYTYSVQERFSSHFDKEGEDITDLESKIRVEVFLEGDEIIVLKHSPKYMIVEVFSNIGGFIGCWLGINLLDIADIFEGFFRIIRYSFKRR